MADLKPTDLGLPPKFTEFRSDQFDTAATIAASDKRFVVLASPTGSGKSIISMTVARLLGGRTLYLTATKGLQQQLTADFAPIGLKDVRGANNYRCVALDKGGELYGYDKAGTTCDEAPCRAGVACTMKPSNDNPFAKGCNYYDAVKAAEKADFVVTNYAFLMAANRYMEPGVIGKFDNLILDEAHDAPDLLSDFVAVTLKESDCDELLDSGLPPIGDGPDAWVEWASMHRPKVEAEIDSLVRAEGKWSPAKIKRARRLHDMAGRLSILSAAYAWHRAEGADPHVTIVGVTPDWVAERAEDGGSVTFSPVWAYRYAEEFLWSGIKRILLVSATILPRTAHYLGIADADFDYVEQRSTFSIERRPIVSVACERSSFRMTHDQWSNVVEAVDQILDLWPNEKGIIHTVSYDRMKRLVDASSYRDRLVHHFSRNAREKIEHFQRAIGPYVLASPAAATGYDFPYDQCRFQIIIKVPFVDSRPAVIKARSKSDKKYLDYLAAQALVQMCGRGMRAADDSCVTYILDDNIRWFMQSAEKFLPRWFRAAYKRSPTLPPRSALHGGIAR